MTAAHKSKESQVPLSSGLTQHRFARRRTERAAHLCRAVVLLLRPLSSEKREAVRRLAVRPDAACFESGLCDAGQCAVGCGGAPQARPHPAGIAEPSGITEPRHRCCALACRAGDPPGARRAPRIAAGDDGIRWRVVGRDAQCAVAKHCTRTYGCRRKVRQITWNGKIAGWQVKHTYAGKLLEGSIRLWRAIYDCLFPASPITLPGARWPAVYIFVAARPTITSPTGPLNEPLDQNQLQVCTLQGSRAC